MGRLCASFNAAERPAISVPVELDAARILTNGAHPACDDKAVDIAHIATHEDVRKGSEDGGAVLAAVRCACEADGASATEDDKCSAVIFTT